MVVLEIVQNQRAWPVVDKLGALVEERRVVFVSLDDEVARVAEARRRAEIRGYAANQEAGRMTGILEDPREHARRRGLAMRAGDGHDVALLQHVLGQPLRPGFVGHAAVQHRFDDFDTPTHDVADDDAIGLDVELAGIDAFMDFDAEFLKLRAHWRVNVAIAARDVVARSARQRSNAAHESSADAENVYVHVRLRHSYSGSWRHTGRAGTKRRPWRRQCQDTSAGQWRAQ